MNLFNKLFKNKENHSNPNENQKSSTLSSDIRNNLAQIQQVFEDCPDVTYRPLKLQVHGRTLEIWLLYSKVLVDLNNINENIIKPISNFQDNNSTIQKKDSLTLDLFKEIITVNHMDKIDTIKDITKNILSGNTILLVNHCKSALILNTPGGENRSISESTIERVIRGPKDSFIEDIDTNMGLIRSKIKSPLLKIKNMTMGRHTFTTVSILYMDNLVNQEVLSSIISDLEKIQAEDILDSSYIEQHLEKHPFSPFPQTQITERPDKVCGNLLEGRISILVDGSPTALILPATFFQFFQSPEDYYTRTLSSNLTRWLRFLGFFIATSLPAIYVAFISFHHEMIPMNLLVDLSRTRANVPFPPVIEAILMEITIELIREASNRLPHTISQTIGIVGAIVIGDAAIQSNLASPTMVIIIAVTAIGSYIFPHYNTSYALRLIRIPIILMAATFGAFGIIIAWCWIIVHLCSLDSLGYPYFSPLAPLNQCMLTDNVTRRRLRLGKKSGNKKANKTRLP